MDKIKSLNIDYTRGSYLFLQGVFKTDCKKADDIFKDRLTDHNVSNLYKKLPAVFTKLQDWPRKTNLLCCRCSRKFDDMPWFIPQSIEPVSSGPIGCMLDSNAVHEQKTEVSYSIIPEKVFCSENCAAAYIIGRPDYTLAKKRDRLAMLKILYKIITGRCVVNIFPSPDPTCMQQYGGDITPWEYQEKINNLRQSYQIKNDENINELINDYSKYFLQ